MTQDTSERSIDELARGLAEGTISRRQALKLAGYGMLGVALSGMGFADTAEALTRRQRRRCRRKGGTLLERGECRCAGNCGADLGTFVCRNTNGTCACQETIEGRGVCANFGSLCGTLKVCSSSSECPPGSKCIIDTPCEERCEGARCVPVCPRQ
jgi:hypothetical protein